MLETLITFMTSEYFVAPVVILGFSYASFLLTKKYLLKALNRLVCHGNKKWRPIFDEKQPFKQLRYLVPVLVISFGLQYLPEISQYTARVLNAYVIINLTLLLNAVMNTFLDVYGLYPISKERPIKSYVQMGGIFLYIVGGVLGICALLDKDPWMFISGIGALTAIIMLVFRDTILSFIAGIQILGNNLIQKDDWIEVPAYGADGAVIDVALHVIKVQNWDKTVVTIPTYKVIECGFKNWRGMYEAGGRRIKRSLLIDQTSLAFMDRKRLSCLADNKHIKKYMADFFDKVQKGADESEADLWEVTNLGVFRRYVEAYLGSHPKINTKMTFIIRLLDPTPTGIPLELYIFTRDTEWAKYENVQSEIFEHFMAVMPVFGLHIYQKPTGYDVERLADIEGGRVVKVAEVARRTA